MTVQKLTPSSNLRLPCSPSILKTLELQVFQVSTQNMQLAPCLQKRRKFPPGLETGLEVQLPPARLGWSPTTHCPLNPATSYESGLLWACSRGMAKNTAPAKSWISPAQVWDAEPPSREPPPTQHTRKAAGNPHFLPLFRCNMAQYGGLKELINLN